MNNITIVLTVAGIWLGLGVVFMGLCMAAGRADRDMEDIVGNLEAPRTLRQHVFAVHVRSLRTMRRLSGGCVKTSRSVASRERVTDQPGLRPFHSA